MLLFIMPLGASQLQGQSFGCFETPGLTSSHSYVIDRAYVNGPSAFSFEWDSTIYTTAFAPDGYFTSYFEATHYHPRHVKMEGYIKNGKKEGDWKLYSEAGTVIAEGAYINNQRQNSWRAYYWDNSRDTLYIWKGAFKNNLEEGKFRYYNRDKILYKEKTYHEGKLEGWLTEYNFETGKEITRRAFFVSDKFNKELIYEGAGNGYYLSEEKNFQNDKKEGFQTIFNKGDTVSSEQYLKGRKEGESRTFYSGRWLNSTQSRGLKTSAFYKNDSLNGPFHTYYENGKLKSEIIWKNDRPFTTVSAFSESGLPLDAGTLKDGDGVLRCYYPNGNMSSFVTYKNQWPAGEYMFYYDSLKIKAKGNYTGRIYLRKYNNKRTYYSEDINGWSIYSGYGSVGEYYENGNMKVQETVINDEVRIKITGVTYDETGRLECRYYPDSSSSFNILYRYDDGRISSVFCFLITQYAGHRKDFYPSGTVRFEGDYINHERDSDNTESRLDGTWHYYFESGKPQAIITFTNGVKTGRSFYFDRDGHLRREEVITQGRGSYDVFDGDTVNVTDSRDKKQGKWLNFPTSYGDECNDVPDEIKYYKNDKPTRTWLFYSPPLYGSLLQTKYVWTDSVMAFCQDFFKGKVVKEGYELDMNTKTGIWKEFNSDKGYLEREGEYKNGRREGPWKNYNRRGKAMIVNYHLGKVLKSKGT